MKPLISMLFVSLFAVTGNLGMVHSSADAGDGLVTSGTDLLGVSLSGAAAADELPANSDDWFFDWLIGKDIDQPDLHLGLDVGVSVLDTPADDSVPIESQVTANIVTYYVIQIEYAYQVRASSGFGWYVPGPGGSRRRQPRPTYNYFYRWVSVAESTNLEDAEWMYAWYAAAAVDGVLDEIAPYQGSGVFPTRVQLITEQRPVVETLVDGE